MIITEGDEDEIFTADDWQDVWIDITLDSGACRHVLPRQTVPGYPVQDSLGSRRGASFIVGDGGRIPNEGQVALNLEASGNPIQTVFQVADLTRPLMSVSQVCEQGFDCVFKDTHALVVDKAGAEVCRFERQELLYVAKMKFKAPSPFVRPS